MANDMRNQLIKAGLAPKNDRRGYNQGKQNNGYASRNMNNISGYVAPLNYSPVDDGEKVIKNIKKNKYNEIALTTSQIRKFLTAVNVVRNKVELFKAQNKACDALSRELTAEVKFLKVNLLYQAGKDKSGTVKNFVEVANLEAIINDIGNDLQKFADFCKYVEALVAYHKFLGGKD
mgnify:FL=1